MDAFLIVIGLERKKDRNRSLQKNGKGERKKERKEKGGREENSE